MIEYLLTDDLEVLKCAIERFKRLPGNRWRQLYLPRILTVAGYGFSGYCAVISASG